MKSSARKWFGGMLVGTALVTGLGLALSGTSLMSVEWPHAESYPSDSHVTSFVTVVHVHWPVVMPLVAGAVGLLLVLIPRREKANG